MDTIDGKSSGKFNVFSSANDPNFGIPPSELREYDFGLISSADCQNYTNITQPPSKTPSRDTVIKYHQFAAAPTYPSRAFVGFPDSVSVSGTGGNSSLTTYTYDGAAIDTTIDSVSNIAQHDDVVGHYDPSVQGPRGNVTSISRQVNSSASITTSFTYDQAGNQVTATDGRGYKTTYSYKDTFSSGGPPSGKPAYAFMGNETLPTTSTSSTSYSHVLNYRYSYSDSHLVEADDMNGQATNYVYSDLFGRLTSVTGPPSAQNNNQRPTTTYAYTDGTTPKQVVTDPAGIQTETDYDGMGHATATVQLSDPAGADYTRTIYDGYGRVYQAWNPSRCDLRVNPVPTSCANEPTFGYTQNTYDNLGRLTQVKNPDNTTKQWCYNGVATASLSSCPANQSSTHSNAAWVNDYDENLNHMQHIYDAFGRLVSVMEPDATNTPNIETDYKYDVLGNLTNVDEYGAMPGSADANRSFGYDELGRMTRATNIESGTTSYGYDKNGNVVTKTDARGTTIRYCYDALNRLLSKSSPDQGCPAPSPYAVMSYDQSSVTVGNGTLAIKNGLGRMMRSRAGTGAPPIAVHAPTTRRDGSTRRA